MTSCCAATCAIVLSSCTCPQSQRRSRRTERTFWPAFRADYPRILGGVLDAIVGGLRELPSVDLKELPRMADYAEWGEATGRGLGWGAETFMSTYNDNRKEATEVLLEDSPVATVMLALARKGINWSGTPLELYEAVVKIAGNTLGPQLAQNDQHVRQRIAPHRSPASLARTFHHFRAERRRTHRHLESGSRRHGHAVNYTSHGHDGVIVVIVGWVQPTGLTPFTVGCTHPTNGSQVPACGVTSRRHGKVAVVTLDPIMQCLAVTRIVNHCIWQCSATDCFMRISRAAES